MKKGDEIRYKRRVYIIRKICKTILELRPKYPRGIETLADITYYVDKNKCTVQKKLFTSK